ERLKKWSWRHQTAVLAAGAVLLVTTVALAVSLLLIALERNEKEAALDKSLKNESLAIEQTAIARRENLAARRREYVADMHQASRLVSPIRFAVDVSESRTRLSKFVPQPGEQDVRGPEWHFLKSIYDRDALATLKG